MRITHVESPIIAEESVEANRPSLQSCAFDDSFEQTFADRIADADDFYVRPHRFRSLTPTRQAIMRQSYAGLLWTKQFYHYVVSTWLDGDPNGVPASPHRKHGRNADWRHLFNRDVISMPDKWEYPWYAAWDLAFHMVPFADLDPHFAKEQMILFLREWYMHPSGQIPGLRMGNSVTSIRRSMRGAFGRSTKRRASRCSVTKYSWPERFQKLLINFTWWVNQKDPRGKNIFAGGFLGLDNIGVFDRSKPLPRRAPGTSRRDVVDGVLLRFDVADRDGTGRR